MKKSHIAMLAAFGVLLALIAGAGAVVFMLLGADPGPVELKLRFSRGAVYRVRREADAELRSDYLKEANVKLSVKAEYRWTVESLDAKGNATVRVSPLSLKGTYTKPESEAEPFNIPLPADGIVLTPMPPLSALGHEAALAISPDGSIKKVKVHEQVGMDAAGNEVWEEMTGDEATYAQTMLKNHFSGVLGPCPGRTVRRGDAWKRPVVGCEGILGAPLLDVEYKLKSRKDGKAVVECDSSRTTMGLSGFAFTPMDSFSIETVTGTRTGRHELDEASGCVVNAEVKSEMKGQAKSRGRFGGIMGMRTGFTVSARETFRMVEEKGS